MILMAMEPSKRDSMKYSEWSELASPWKGISVVKTHGSLSSGSTGSNIGTLVIVNIEHKLIISFFSFLFDSHKTMLVKGIYEFPYCFLTLLYVINNPMSSNMKPKIAKGQPHTSGAIVLSMISHDPSG
jgi:hypothetical protein